MKRKEAIDLKTIQIEKQAELTHPTGGQASPAKVLPSGRVASGARKARRFCV